MTEPAHIQGNKSSGFVEFVKDSRGDLVDLVYTCFDDGFGTGLEGALRWPCFDFGDGGAYCHKCGACIEEPREYDWS